MNFQLKIDRNGNVKRCKWAAPEQNIFNSMLDAVGRIFPDISEKIRDPEVFRITYSDEDGTDITLDSEEAANIFLEEICARFTNVTDRPIILPLKIVCVAIGTHPPAGKLIRDVEGAMSKFWSPYSMDDQNRNGLMMSNGTNVIPPMLGTLNSLYSEPAFSPNEAQHRKPNNFCVPPAMNCLPMRPQRGESCKMQGERSWGRHPKCIPPASKKPEPMAPLGVGNEPKPSKKVTPDDKEKVVHHGVMCDSCDKIIAGVRYKSVVVENYDLCETCENGPAGNENAPYLKINRPNQVPELIICGVNGEIVGNCGRRRWHNRPGRPGRGCGMRRRGQLKPATTLNPDESVEMQTAIGESLQKPAEEETKEEEKVDSTDLSSNASETPNEINENDKRRGQKLESGHQKIPVVNEGDMKRSLSGEFEILEIAEKTEQMQIDSTPVNIPEQNEDTNKRKRAKYWENELTQLAGIGFTDFKHNMDLLEKYVGTPGKEGLEKVLNALMDE